VNGGFHQSDECRIRELEATVARLTEERDKLQAFKDWVHGWLDKAGVPHDPDAEHNTQTGCRIGGRLEWIKLKIDLLRRERDKLLKSVHSV
jgi:hypothetical protein